MTPEENQNDVFINIKSVGEILCRSKASIYRDIADKKFPPQTKIGGSSRWRRSEVLAVLKDGY